MSWSLKRCWLKKGTGTATNGGLNWSKLQGVAEPVPFFIRICARADSYRVGEYSEMVTPAATAI